MTLIKRIQDHGYAVTVLLLLVLFLGSDLHAESETSDTFKEQSVKAVMGDPFAQYVLFRFYQEGYGVQQDTERSLYWLQMSAISGYPQAQYLMGASYIISERFPQESAIAIFWLQLASDQGHELATAQLEKLLLMNY